jgi:KUP system potassium uptake protein
MLLTTILIGVVVAALRGPRWLVVFPVLALVGGIELVFFASNATKIPAGGWFPLACGLLLYVVLSTWKTGTELVSMVQRRMRVPLEGLFGRLRGVATVPGTAIFFSADVDSAPATLLHVLKRFKVLYERVVVLTIVNADVPRVPDEERARVRVLEPRRRYQVVLRYGFMENPDIPRALKLLERNGLRFDVLDTTFFLGRTTIARPPQSGLFTWRRELFRWMQRNAPSAAEYLRLPVDRVVELGTQIAI